MFDFKKAKLKAKQQMKEHYVIFTVICLLASFIGVNYTFSMSTIKSFENEISLISEQGIRTEDTFKGTSEGVLEDLIFSSLNKGEDSVRAIQSENTSKDAKVGGIVALGYRRGIFAGIANSLSSGSLFVLIYKVALQQFRNNEMFAKVLVGIVGLLMFAILAVVKGVYNVSYRRIFLESYIYSEVKAPRFLFIVRAGHVIDAAFTAIIKELYQLLWNLTIVGGVIKFFSYSQVYYIVAENPSVKPNLAIKLSRDMMNGHKMELFKFYLSYIGWFILNLCTLGISGILYSNAYLECGLLEFYVYVRGLAKENNIENARKFNDTYLYEFADEKDLIEAYPDLYKRKDKSIELPEIKGAKGWFVRNCGVALTIDDEIKKYNEAISEKNEAEVFKDIFNKENYPANLGPAKEGIKYKEENVDKNKVYSLTNLIYMFFIFAFVGWMWEVMLHIVNDGVFVNRGTMHGPWLPIYGSGVILILLFLYRTRQSLATHFFSSIALCGVVEYYSHYFLEVTKGMKWWDYTGYFLNINGRICGEGLLVFGLGGTAAVFLLVPMINNSLEKMKPNIKKVLVTILTLCFLVDLVYSQFVPNAGAGISDYEDVSLPETAALIERDKL